MKKALKWTGLVVGGLIALCVVWNWQLIATLTQQVHMFTEPHFDTEDPELPRFQDGMPKILAFSKTNGFRHHESIQAAATMLEQIAQARGWMLYATENNNVFNADILNHFDIVVLNNSSGTLYTKDQQKAFIEFAESGGGVVALHAAGGDPSYDWDWYVNELIRAQFVDHPMRRHIQSAVIRVADPNHPILSNTPLVWQREDEWYNFQRAPTGRVNVLLRIDETSYDPERSPMGEDHPMAWTHLIGEGRVFYTALGHTPETYSEPRYKDMVARAMRWTLNLE